MALGGYGSPRPSPPLPVVVQAWWHTRELAMAGEGHCDDRRNKPRQDAAEKLTEDF